MKWRSARKLIIHTCEKYWDAKHSYKKLLIYCYLEQGANFPLSIDDLMRCYSPETIRRSFQYLKAHGEINVPEEVQADWNRKEKLVRASVSPRNVVEKTPIPQQVWDQYDNCYRNSVTWERI